MNRGSRVFIPICLMLTIGILASMLSMRVRAGNYIDVSVVEAETMIDQSPSLVVLDVRNQSEYDEGHIRNSKLIPVWQLSERLDKLSKNQEILVYSEVGERSASASLTLSDNGFTQVYNMLGGLAEWINAGYAVYVKYSSIQAAIDNAAQGSSIDVSVGTYNETLSINKPVTLTGENKSTTIIDGNGTGNVIEVVSENVTITGFTIQGAGCSCDDFAGIHAQPVSRNLNITENLMTKNGYSIIVKSSNSTIGYNEITGNSDSIQIIFSNSNLIVGNKIEGNERGLNLIFSSGSTIAENNISYNNMYNVMLSSSNANIFRSNTIKYSTYGIGHYLSFNNTFIGNSILYNIIGIDFQNSSNNTFCQNSFVEDQVQFSEVDPVMPNTWDSGNITGGNYWSNYTGTDSNGDGIGDSPQVLDSGNKDNFPLMGMVSTLTVSEDKVSLSSNSTVEDFRYFNSNATIQIRVTNASMNQLTGFCRLIIPLSVLTPSYEVTINGSPTTYTTLFENDTTSIIYFTYNHSTLEIDVIPEYPTPVFLALISIISLLLLAVYRRNASFNSRRPEQDSTLR